MQEQANKQQLERRERQAQTGGGGGEGQENAGNSFQQMKLRNQMSMSTSQIIKYHNFVGKRAKKVFTSMLKGYSPV